MYTGNIKGNITHSFLSFALTDAATAKNEPKFSPATSLALCLADSMIRRYLVSSKSVSPTDRGGFFDIRYQATQYIKWWRQGYLSTSQDLTPDRSTQTALEIWEDGLKRDLSTTEIVANVRSSQLQENTSTSVAWVLPVALVFWRDRVKAFELAQAAADVLSPASRDLAGWYVTTVAAVLWESAQKESQKVGKASLRIEFEAEYKRLGLQEIETAEDVCKGVMVFLETNNFGDGLRVATRLKPEVAMAYAGIAGAWYGTRVKNGIGQTVMGYNIVEKVVGGLGALVKVLEKNEDDEMQNTAAGIPLDDEHEGVL